jgi:hypothetical protein
MDVSSEKGVLEFQGFCKRAKAGDAYVYHSGHLAFDCEPPVVPGTKTRSLNVPLCRLRNAVWQHNERGLVHLLQRRVQHIHIDREHPENSRPPIWDYIATRSSKPLKDVPTFGELMRGALT